MKSGREEIDLFYLCITQQAVLMVILYRYGNAALL